MLGDLDSFLADESPDWDYTDIEAGDFLPEFAGRLCYMSFKNQRPGGNAAYLKHIKECSHGSTFEHSTFGFLFTGVSRSLTHELVRHRAGMAYSQLSQRYVDESVAEYVVPPDIARLPHVRDEWERAVQAAHNNYVWLVQSLVQELLEQKWPELSPADRQSELKALPVEDRTALRKAARSAARSVLPNATETKIVVTANARAWRHFLEMRASRHADVEIRKLAVAVYEVLVVEAPNLFDDYTKVTLPDGTCELQTPYRKV